MAEELRALTDVCVHCGFCLPACPTYQLDGAEADSPRGRIHLIRQLLDAPVSDVTGPVRRHLDTCLGCLACVPACPSGVAYDRIIEGARPMVEPGRGPRDRLRRAVLFATFPYPRRLSVLRGPLRLAQRLGADRSLRRFLPGTLATMLRLAPPVRPRTRLPERLAATGSPRAVVGLLTGCVQSAFFSHVSAATARVLQAHGYEVVVPRGQGCCGALSAHTGRVAQARRLARRTVGRFHGTGVEFVVTDVAGCGSTMKQYAHLLADDPVWGPRAARLATMVRDVTELLAEAPPRVPRQPVKLTVAYHDACHLSHGQGVRAQPRDLLREIPGLRLVPIPDADTCCGSAGVYNLLQPGPAARLGARKAEVVRATGADVVVAGNPGCLLQLRAALDADGGPPLPALHTVELLDRALTGGG